MKHAIQAAIGIILLAGAVVVSFAQGAPSPEKVLKNLDQDRDGRISRQEWRGPVQRFLRFDTNSDGFLSVDEIRSGRKGKVAQAANTQKAIDVHTHIHAHPNSSPDERKQYDYSAAADVAASRMAENSIEISIIMPPPGIRWDPDSDRSVLQLASLYPGRFVAMAGGSTLNPLIQKTPPGKVTEAIRRQFAARAEEILTEGAVGFGEMAALHFSFFTYHPFEESPPDHPLFLLLADIAAAHDVPIDLHDELVLADMDTPSELLKRSKRNPPRVKENLKGLEILLSHNEKARIILSHSADSTGGRKASVIRGLLERHSNLYMSLNVLPGFPLLQNMPLKAKGPVAPDWLQLITDYPDRFLIGSDQFFIAPCATCQTADSLTPTLRWLSALPPEIAQKIALENPRRIYKID